MKPFYRDLAFFQFLIASRIGEAAGIQWDRIDFENKKIVIMETCHWNSSSKTFVQLNPHPKNKEPRICFMTPELEKILRRRLAHKIDGNNFVFHVEGAPLSYATIQQNYRDAYRKAGIKNSGTHCLRHGMAVLARKVGGGFGAVMAMTGHKDYKLADHCSKLSEEYQQEFSEEVSDFLNNLQNSQLTDKDNNLLLFSKTN